MDKSHQSPVGALPGSFIDELYPGGLQFRHRGVDILHFQGQVVEALSLVFQELGHRAIRGGGQEQFQVAFPDLDEAHLDLLGVNYFLALQLQAKIFGIEFFRGIQILHRDSQMSNAFDLHKTSSLRMSIFFLQISSSVSGQIVRGLLVPGLDLAPGYRGDLQTLLVFRHQNYI